MAELVQDLLESQAKHNPEQVALVYEGRKHTYADLDVEANRVSHWLRQGGVEPGDRVLLYGHNSDCLVAALFGVVKAGAVFVLLGPDTSHRKLKFVLQDCTPRAIVADTHLVDAHDGITSWPVEAVLLTSNSNLAGEAKQALVAPWKMIHSFPSDRPSTHVTPTDLGAIIYTSGSTKDPRGVMEPHRQIVFATSAINAVIGNRADDTVLCGIPLSFDYGLYQVFLTFQAGAKLILEREFTVPMSIPRLLRMHRVTGFPAVPSVFALLLRSRLLERVDLFDLRYITSTGDVFPTSHIRRLRELLPHVTIFPMYGLTECKRVSIMPQGQMDGRESSVGLPLPGTGVSIVDADGCEVPSERVGRLVVRGPHVMAGYWRDPEETKRRFRRDDRTGETSLYTGDFFRMDKDGFLYFVSRDATIIKSHGQRVSPAEIESVVCEIEGTAEAAAVGAPHPIMGESVCLFVSLIEASNLTASDIAARCRSYLSPIERPRHIRILETALPKTPNGKIDRSQLQRMATELAGRTKC